MSSPYGTSPWGLGVWGGAPPHVAVLARATSTRTVLVELSTAPRALSGTGPGDALNPRTWSVRLPDLSRIWTVLTVRRVGASSYELALLQKLLSHLVTHEVKINGLVNPSGIPFAPPYELPFLGVVAAVRGDRRPWPDRDLASAPVPGEEGGETRVMASSGDYASQYGLDVLRKILLRRIFTDPDSFYHLAGRDFGLGLTPKRIVRPTDLPALKKAAERQAMAEPGVLFAEARVSLRSGGMLELKLRVRTEAGMEAVLDLTPED